jgi:hypothetical protein
MQAPAGDSSSFTPEKILRELLASPPAWLPPKKVRRLRMMAALVDGETGASIAKREGVSTAAVSKLKKEMERRGVSEEISRLLKPAKDGRKPGARKRAGRPGYEQFAQWSAKVSADDEPVFELATLLLSREVQVATIAIRNGRKADFKTRFKDAEEQESNEERINFELQMLRRTLEKTRGTPVYWTRVSILDTMLAEVFQWLGECVPRIKGGDPGNCGSLNVTPLKERFGPRFSHLIISSGASDSCEAVSKRLGDGVRSIRVPVDSQVGFLSHLEAILHHRRLTKSCVGLLPGISDFYHSAKKWNFEPGSQTFLYQQSESSISESVATQILTQDYFAVRGILPSMNGFLWSKIAYQDGFPFMTLSKSPEIHADRECAPGKVRVEVTPIPNLSYRVDVPWNGSTTDFEKRARALYRTNTATRQFVYSTEKSSGHGKIRSSIALREDFQMMTDESSEPKPVGVALIVRHFLLPAPLLPLEELSTVLPDGEEPGCFFAEADERFPDPLEILYVPYLFDALQENSQIVEIQNRLASVEKWQSLLTEVGQSAKAMSGKSYDLVFLKLRPKAVLEEDEWDMFMGSVRPDATSADLAAIVERRIHEEFESHPQKDVIGRRLERLTVSEAQIQHLAESVDLSKLSAPGFFKQLAQNLSDLNAGLRSGVTEERTKVGRELTDQEKNDRRARLSRQVLARCSEDRALRLQNCENILKELDADFLLRILDRKTRARLEADAGQWAAACESVIAGKYWPDNKFDFSCVASIIDAGLRPAAVQHRKEVESICNDARARFCRDKRFAIRSVMETMQRCVLHGLPPLAIAVASHKSILARWRAFLRSCLKKRLPEFEGNASRQDEYDDESGQDYLVGSATWDASSEDGYFDSSTGGEILEVVSRVLDGDCSEKVLLAFDELAREGSLKNWRDALAELAETRSPGGAFKNIRSALALCRKSESKNEANRKRPVPLVELRRLLKNR